VIERLGMARTPPLDFVRPGPLADEPLGAIRVYTIEKRS
jgi:hypothetical protein